MDTRGEQKGTRPILKKPAESKRPSSLGHHSSRSESSDADRPMSLNRKRLSWGVSKVLEFRAHLEGQNKDDPSPDSSIAHNRDARRSQQFKANELSPKNKKYI